MAVRPLVVAGRVNQRLMKQSEPVTALREQSVRAGRPAAFEIAHMQYERERLVIDLRDHADEAAFFVFGVGRIAESGEGEVSARALTGKAHYNCHHELCE